VLDLAVGTDHERRARDSHHLPAVHVLFLHDAKLVRDFLIRIGQQSERQAEFVLKLLLRRGGVCRNADNDRTSFRNLLVCVTKPGRFCRSTGSVGFGVEEQHNCFAAKIF
jgi:hypothetical protein